MYSFSICMKSQLHLHCESTSKWNPIQFLHLFFDVFGTVACPHAQSDHCLHDWIQETSLSASSEKITQVNGALCTAAGILTSVPGFAQWSTCHVHPSSSCNGEMEEAPFFKKSFLYFTTIDRLGWHECVFSVGFSEVYLPESPAWANIQRAHAKLATAEQRGACSVFMCLACQRKFSQANDLKS